MAKTPRVLRGQVAAITGGARGIGRATAEALLAQGMKVAIGDLDVETAQRTAQELSSRGEIRAYALNVVEPESHEAFIAAIENDLGPVDVYVNNAGIMPVGRFLDQDPVSDRRQIDINIFGVLNGMRAILPRFEQRHSGHLVNIASAAGKGGFPGVAVYCGTKHFVVGVSEAVHLEYKDSPIAISCVMPAFVNTELVSGLSSARGVKNAEPADVGAEIVRALQAPRFDVFVPRMIGPINKVMAVLPRGAREGVAHALKADQVMLDVDQSGRAAYELRTSKNDPGLESGDEQKQLTP